MRNDINTYNNGSTVLVITSYPNPEHGKFGKRNFNAIGEHSERRLPYLAQQGKILVAAEKAGKVTTFEAKENLLIHRIWQKGNYFSFFKLFWFILKNNHIRSIFVQFEFNVFGGIIPNLLLLAMLFVLRMMGKKITFELHQVILDIATLFKHVPIRGKILQTFFNISLRMFYVLLGCACTQIIVFENDLKHRLAPFVSAEKIHVLCLSVVEKTLPQKAAARKKLGLSQNEFIVMQFGYINGYKGIDWTIQALADINDQHYSSSEQSESRSSHTARTVKQKVRYLVVGGPNPYLKNQPFYKAFYTSIMAGIKKHAHMSNTGFISEELIRYYYGAADLVIMPYEVFMAASGPFSQALAHGQALIISEKLAMYAKSQDFKKALEETGVTKADLFFTLTKKDLQAKIRLAQKNPAYRKKLQSFTKNLAQKRSSTIIMRQLYLLLLPHHLPAAAYVPAPLMVQS